MQIKGGGRRGGAGDVCLGVRFERGKKSLCVWLRSVT